MQPQCQTNSSTATLLKSWLWYSTKVTTKMLLISPYYATQVALKLLSQCCSLRKPKLKTLGITMQVLSKLLVLHLKTQQMSMPVLLLYN